MYSKITPEMLENEFIFNNDKTVLIDTGGILYQCLLETAKAAKLAVSSKIDLANMGSAPSLAKHFEPSKDAIDQAITSLDAKVQRMTLHKTCLLEEIKALVAVNQMTAARITAGDVIRAERFVAVMERYIKELHLVLERIHGPADAKEITEAEIDDVIETVLLMNKS